MGEILVESDVKKIKEEIEHRETVLRPEILESLKAARAQGDLSENFEYYAAKRDNNRNNSRIDYLKRMISTATIYEDKSKDDEIGIDTEVVIFIEEDAEDETYRVVTGVRSDSINHLVSIQSPIGKALLGHKVGDRIEIKVDDKYSYYAIVRSITKNVDNSGDKITS